MLVGVVVVWNEAGHGQSEGERVYIEEFDDYIADYTQFLDTILQQHPHLKALPRFLSGYRERLSCTCAPERLPF
jgi:alpha-beta hydrolase superfamily lysophospholipase